MSKTSIPTSQLIFPSAEQVTANQIGNLLQIGSMAMVGLLGGSGNQVNLSGVPTESIKPELPGEAKPAAENLFVAVCEKLEELVKDKNRWGMEKQQALEQEFLKAHQLNQEYLEYQAQNAFNLTTPHFRFHPQLAKCANGQFAAILGNPHDLDNAIVGLGDSPTEALEAFDDVFYRGVPAQVEQYLQRREQDIENGIKPAEYPNLKNEQQQSKPVVSKGNVPIEKAKRRRPISRRNRKATRKDSKGSGTKGGAPGDSGDGNPID